MNQANVLIVEDDAALQEALSDTLELAGFHTLTANDGRMAMDILANESVDMVVSDVQMQRMDGHALLREIKTRDAALPVLLMTAHGSIERAVEAMREGAADYLVKPFDAEVLVAMVSQYVSVDNTDSDFIAVAPSSREVQQVATRVADSDATVMITGESGTGKEVLARYIHRQSPRAKAPFVAINCAAIPENMLEATLFGYEKGAFTGAYKANAGKFEQAQGGTLLLDEISEMDLGLQAKILRVLQEREVERLGGNTLLPLDVRVLATSNRDMRAEVTAGRFREDLFYRLNVFPVHLSPLRERTEDIQPIAVQLLRKQAVRAGKPVSSLSAQAIQQLTLHSWPGNVRELDNVMQRALILCSGNEIDASDLIFEAAPAPAVVDEAVAAAPVVQASLVDMPETTEASLGGDLKRHEHTRIIDMLKNCMGNRKLAAEKLGISPRTLRYKLARMRDDGIVLPG
ncbi:sigma-54-dependent transcriptional regulator [Sulfuriflexus mobilis]|uniref:sigma-54-dependent transcriptional regulator n=1 Tax=Sulfuriflexus mobilis TaxID=1811807 RepID=UPI000F83809E|nr:sigma-54 dependent transcriptional regulator [Sulfuriflexus mobilis]